MVRQRAPSTASTTSASAVRDQELGSMYDYLAKIILLGPSGCGKSCLLHRFVKNEWRVFSSQTIGVEFASKIIKVGSGARRKRIKLQLWDTAGTERFRSVSRSYYRGAAGAILVYDIGSFASFRALPTFLNDARALASPQLTVILAGNKKDLEDSEAQYEPEPSILDEPIPTPSSVNSRAAWGSLSSSRSAFGGQNTVTVAPEGREVSTEVASRWATDASVPVSVEVSALSGDNVEEVFSRLARMILTKIEIGEIDPDDPQSGIQYGDSGSWGGYYDDDGSIKSGTTDGGGTRKRRKGKRRGGALLSGVQEWEEVFKISNSRSRGGCC
ncbi:GTP-binding protein ypt4 [Diplodia seriata]|uniref:GTP-binding protein ypt4 n=1 Tax=Diplodia seriata TaxID=420778 RepID=A0A1S8B5M3_9PEZI|nr:GTP-binding protein ypt4 [Diplodia seriata]